MLNLNADLYDSDCSNTISTEASAYPESCAEDPDFLATKRRRCNYSGIESHRSSRLEMLYESDDAIIYNLQPPLPSSTLKVPCGMSPEPKMKKRSFTPKYSTVLENTFVTQLTQPSSSPERIRGPRWKKEDPKPSDTGDSRAEPKGGSNEQAIIDEFDDSDEELKAAIAASLDSFEAENTKTATLTEAIPQQSFANNGTQLDNTVDMSLELENIPESAFDSSQASSVALDPKRNMAFPWLQNQSSFSRPGGQHTSLRQTTLFDMAARSMPLGQPSSLPSKEESLSQHELDEEATATWVYPTNLGKIRDYQFNITQKGLFHNLLVALPTGLGKTFIAATVMLNWFRWTKSAQIIFVAPTKPLVAQQISACFGVAGIRRSETTLLTGETPPGVRAEQWQSKRLFFMTPQTLINDLKSGIADPKRIVLLVIDEAHRATGGYAYVEVVKFLRRYNKSFRILALTATPGSTVESVQAVIDGLDIAKVEIRTENSLDIRGYVHARNVEVQTFENSEDMMLCMSLLSSTLQPLVDQLRALNAYWSRDPMALTAYGLTKARQQWMLSDAGRNANLGLKSKVNAIFTVLASLAHAIDLLKYHGITPFYHHLLHFQSETDGKRGGKYKNQIVQDESFKKLLSHLKPWTSNPEFIGHPKLEYLKQVVLNHFMDARENEGSDSQGQTMTRVMIFAHFRDSAEEIVRVLKRFEPMIRPHVFVGQTSAKGSNGMNQKMQLGVVEKFKKGTYNTIVATSIGEEGLDIGEIDLIICYDSSASPIRMLQRMGRTGRKRAGNIVLLLMQGKEEESYIRAKDNYEKMQQLIASGTRFTFHEDRSPRILPPGVRPEPDKREVEIPVENSQAELPEPKKRSRPPKRPPKKFYMPDDVETGFTKASDLRGSSECRKRKKRNGKGPSRIPIFELVDIPPLSEVLLTPAQEKELQARYCNIGGTSPQLAPFPRNDAFPKLQLFPRPTKIVEHGSLTNRMIDTLQKMRRVGMSCESRYQEILALGQIPREDLPLRRSQHWEEFNNTCLEANERPSDMQPGGLRSERPPKQTNKGNPSGTDVSSDFPMVLTPIEEFLGPGLCLTPRKAGSDSFGGDDDPDLPDISVLIEENMATKPVHKRARLIVDDSEDE